MGTRIKLALMAALAISAMGAAPVGATNGDPCRDEGELYSLGLTGSHRLICFEVQSPEDFFTIGRISGLVGDTDVVGIDYRVANGLLYALGDQGGIYTVDEDDASATKVDQLDIALAGTFFGVDFNPAADALRVISDQGQDLRHPFVGPTAGVTVMDGTLNYVGPPAVSPATGVTGAGYTNNDTDLNTATTLYDIDSNLDQVVIQAPPNSGTLNATGKLNWDVEANVGFDVYSIVDKGTTQRVRGFASLSQAGNVRFYRINLVTGNALVLGGFGPNVQDIALPLNQCKQDTWVMSQGAGASAPALFRAFGSFVRPGPITIQGARTLTAMRISARADYAIRALLELAAAPAGGGLVTGDRIAHAQGIPAKYLENILGELRRARLVESSRGQEGGYRLAREASTIALADVIRAIDGPLAGIRDDPPERVEYPGVAAGLRDVWIALRASMRAVLERVTLADVVDGRLPAPVRRLLRDPDAWTRR